MPKVIRSAVESGYGMMTATKFGGTGVNHIGKRSFTFRLNARQIFEQGDLVKRAPDGAASDDSSTSKCRG